MHPPFHINYLVETVDPRPVSYLNNVEGLSSVGFVNLSRANSGKQNSTAK